MECTVISRGASLKAVNQEPPATKVLAEAENPACSGRGCYNARAVNGFSFRTASENGLLDGCC